MIGETNQRSAVIGQSGAVTQDRPGLDATWLSLAAILLLALGLRLPGLYGTLPDIYQHDQVFFVEGALRIGAGQVMGGSFAEFPHTRQHHFLYLVAIGIWFVIGRLTGLFANVDDFVLAYVTDPSQLLLAGRMVMLAATLGTVWLAYAVGNRLFDWKAGLFAAFLVAISFPSVHMTFAKEDCILSFFLLLALYSAIGIVEQPGRLSRYVLTGALLGVASSAKYLGLVGFLILVVAAWQGGLSKQVKVFRKFLAGCVAFGVAFTCFVPSVVLDSTHFFAGVVETLTVGNSGIKFAQTLGGGAWYGYLWSTYAATVGIVLTCLFYGAMLLIFRERFTAGLLLFAYPIVLTLVLTAVVVAKKVAEVPYYQLSTLPFLCVAVGQLLNRLASSSLRPARWAVPVLVALVTFSNVGDAWKFNRVARTEDSRTVARKWIEAHLPGDSSVLVEGAIFTFILEGPQLRENKAALERELGEVRKHGGSGRLVEAKLRALEVVRSRAPTYNLYKVPDITERDLEEVRPDYVIVRSERGSKAVENSPWEYRLVFSVRPEAPQLFRMFPLLSLADMGRLHQVPLFGSDAVSLMPGPAIWVYQLVQKRADSIN